MFFPFLSLSFFFFFSGTSSTLPRRLAITAPAALAFGFAGASAARSRVAPLRWIGKTYIAMMNLDAMAQMYGGDVKGMAEELAPQMEQMLKLD